MDLQVRDKGYLLVGGTAGMGLAGARALAVDGASLVVVGRDQARADAAAAELAAAGATKAMGLAFDVSQEGHAARAVAGAVEILGRLDGIGITTGTRGFMPIESSDDDWTAAFRDVLLGVSRSVEAALPHLIESRGTIVTTAAFSIRSPELVRLPYASLKGSVALFTKGIAKAYGKDGIRANCICPGAIETDGLHAMRRMVADERGWDYDTALERVMVEEWGMHVALGRPGKPEEVGDLIAFLLSPRAGYLTGALLNIDGGTDF
ncbi:MAG: SDR family oxidoreductase [Candidatus Nanopelagicales bacterium]|nr:SDR family oxidoreductase [Candidatus Nanopelagicales bacterium]